MSGINFLFRPATLLAQVGSRGKEEEGLGSPPPPFHGALSPFKSLPAVARREGGKGGEELALEDLGVFLHDASVPPGLLQFVIGTA